MTGKMEEEIRKSKIIDLDSASSTLSKFQKELSKLRKKG